MGRHWVRIPERQSLLLSGTVASGKCGMPEFSKGILKRFLGLMIAILVSRSTPISVVVYQHAVTLKKIKTITEWSAARSGLASKINAFFSAKCRHIKLR